ISTVHSWNARKSQMKPAHILAALNKLKQENWLSLKAQTA
ncbi:MAG TPA: Appr-1-p processing protein, partial [Pseudoalteromonas prydzensis]|nr:Appr-1-p processing protein [Pseudoalteromonas prydzensis]